MITGPQDRMKFRTWLGLRRAAGWCVATPWLVVDRRLFGDLSLALIRHQ